LQNRKTPYTLILLPGEVGETGSFCGWEVEAPARPRIFLANILIVPTSTGTGAPLDTLDPVETWFQRCLWICWPSAKAAAPAAPAASAATTAKHFWPGLDSKVCSWISRPGWCCWAWVNGQVINKRSPAAFCRCCLFNYPQRTSQVLTSGEHTRLIDQT